MVSFLGQIVTWSSTFLLTIAYGRFLSDVKFGELYFAIALVALVGFPLEYGFNQQVMREVTQAPAKALRYLSNTLLIKGTLWFILYSLLLLVCWQLHYSSEQRTLIYVCGATLLISATSNTFASLHYALERNIFPVIGTILEKGSSALIGFLLLRRGAGVEVMACVLLGGALLSMIWQAAWFYRKVGWGFLFDGALIRGLVRTSVPFLISGTLGVIYYRLDTVLLSLMTNTAVVGWYGAGYRLFDTLIFIPSLIITPIMYPVFSRLSSATHAQLRLAIEKSMNFLLVCSMPMAVGMMVAAPNIIGFLYHRPEYVHTYAVLQGLAPGLVFLYANTVLNSVIISTQREKKIPLMAGIALVFNLGLNFALIPLYQHIAAAAVTSLTELLLLILSLFFTPRHLLPVESLRVGGKALFASVVMAVVIWLLGQFSILIIGPAALVVYVGMTSLLGTIPQDDMRSLLGAMRSKGQRASAIPARQEQEEQTA